MWPLLILILFCGGFVVGPLLAVLYIEVRDWNGGVCAANGMPWVRTSLVGEPGGRMYEAVGVGGDWRKFQVTCITLPWVDRNYVAPAPPDQTPEKETT